MVETSGLVINEAKGEYSLAGEPILEKEVESYLTEHSGTDKVVVYIENNRVGVYTIREAEQFYSDFFKKLFTPRK